MTTPTPVLPRYGAGSIADVVPSLLGGDRSWLPEPTHRARRVVLLVVDGLGHEQLTARRHLAPTLSAMVGSAITSVAPTTTATALTSITCGMTPGEHGIVGYRMRIAGEVLNVLRWSIGDRDARTRVPASGVQPAPPFLATRPPVVARAEFVTSGFTAAHLAGSAYHGWRMPSSLVTEIVRALSGDAPFVYAYYDGIDKVAHEHGLGDHYDAELAFTDHLVASVLRAVPDDCAVVVTADHGQVDVGNRLITPHDEVLAHVVAQSGEGRFRWLHARPGHARDLAEAAALRHGAVAHVVTVEQVIDEHWFGRTVSAAARSRLGDVALVAHEPVSFHDPDDSGPFELIARHGAMTAAEVLVPLLAARGG